MPLLFQNHANSYILILVLTFLATPPQTDQVLGLTAEPLDALASVEHDSGGELTGIAVVVAVAVALGVLLTRLKQPAIVGYILAGVVLGPTGLALVQRSDAIALLAELGVLMLLFIIGMELSLKAFIMVLRPAVIVMFGQLAFALGVSALFGWVLDWPLYQTLILAFIVALSSTAAAMKILEEIGELRTEIGRITVGVMIAQDLAIVPMLILAESYGNGGGALGIGIVLKIGAALLILFGLIYALSRRGKIHLPATSALTGRVDLIALAAIAFCFCAAALSGLFGLSAAYGAFLAGLIVSASTIRAEAIRVTEPIQSVLIVIFFLSIGLLIDLQFILSNLLLVVTFTFGVVFLKTVVNIGLLRMAREPWERALPAGLAMAQIGEFSFVLAAIGIKNGALDAEAYKLAISIIAMTLLISPLWMVTVRRFHDLAEQGVTDFRAALAEVYAEELREIEHGSTFLRGLMRGTHRRIKAAARMRRMRQNAQHKAAPPEPATAPANPAD